MVNALPRYRTSSTCGEAHAVALVAQDEHVSRNCISTRTSPSSTRLAASSGTLNEKWLAVNPRDFASRVNANSSQDGSNALRYDRV